MSTRQLSFSLDDVRRPVSLCIKCGCCIYGDWPENPVLCPLYSYDRTFTASPGGLIYVVRALLEKHIDYSPSMAELAFTCAGCGACDVLCRVVSFPSPHVGIWDIIRLLRSQLVKRGLFPNGKTAWIYDQIRKKGDYLDKGQGINLRIPKKIMDDKGSTVLFAECFHTDAQSKIFESALRLLEKIGKPISRFSDGGCCGSTLYDLGFWEQLGVLANAKWEKMKAFEDKEFIFINPHCHEFILKRYPEIIPGYNGIKSRHFSELLVNAFREGKLKSKNLSKIKISYHDPCYLGRGLGVYEPPRETLSFLSGVELVEMARNRANSLCCGARALGKYLSNFQQETAKKRLGEFRATGADLLITSCPYCKDAFQKVMGDEEGERVKDLIEFVDERTG